MLYTLAVVLIVLWALGMVSSYTMGGFIHLLLAVAIIMVLVNVIRAGRTAEEGVDEPAHRNWSPVPAATKQLSSPRLCTTYSPFRFD